MLILTIMGTHYIEGLPVLGVAHAEAEERPAAGLLHVRGRGVRRHGVRHRLDGAAGDGRLLVLGVGGRDVAQHPAAQHLGGGERNQTDEDNNDEKKGRKRKEPGGGGGHEFRPSIPG